MRYVPMRVPLEKGCRNPRVPLSRATFCRDPQQLEGTEESFLWSLHTDVCEKGEVTTLRKDVTSNAPLRSGGAWRAFVTKDTMSVMMKLAHHIHDSLVRAEWSSRLRGACLGVEDRDKDWRGARCCFTAWTWMGLLRVPIQRTVRDQVTGTCVGASSDALHQAHFSVQGPHGFECTVQQQHSSFVECKTCPTHHVRTTVRTRCRPLGFGCVHSFNVSLIRDVECGSTSAHHGCVALLPSAVKLLGLLQLS